MTGGTIDLGTFLGAHIFALGLVFCRLGACFMMLPGIGETTVPARTRLLLGLAISLVLLPAIEPLLPPMPKDAPGLATLIAGETLVGLFFGIMVRCLMSVLDTAGMLISLQLGLGNAAIFNPEMATQGSLPGTMLALAGLILIFMTNAHHAMLRGLAGSYMLFKPGHVFAMLDYSQTVSEAVSKSFYLGVALAAPFIVIGTVFHIVLGLIARMIPQLQLYFMALPVQILGGLFAFTITFSTIMMFWLNRMPDFVPGFVMTGG